MRESFSRSRMGIWGILACVIFVTAAGCSDQSGESAKSQGQTNDGSASQAGPEIVPPGNAEVNAAGTPQSIETRSPQKILEDMVATYRKATRYADMGRVSMRGTVDGQPLDAVFPLVTAFERPNKLRLELSEAVVVCDGKEFKASIRAVVNQVLNVPAPPEITLESLFDDPMLGQGLMMGPTQAVSWLPPPLVLMLADDPLKTLLYQSDEPKLLPPGTLEDHFCNRVQIDRPDGSLILWIDQKSNLLLRINYPIDEFERMLRLQGGAQNVLGLGITADFVNAGIDGELPAEAFVFEVPPDRRIVERFEPFGFELLGKKPEAFSFTDLEGNAVTSESLAGKPVVLQFWSVRLPASQPVLQAMQSLAAEYGDRIHCYAVSVDATADTPTTPAIRDSMLQSQLAQWQVQLPILRDPDEHAEKVFGVRLDSEMPTLPATVILSPDGKVQVFSVGYAPDLPEQAAAWIDKLLNGVDVAAEERARLDDMRSEMIRIVGRMVEQGLFIPPREILQPISDVEPVPASLPSVLKREDIFSCEALTTPGNVCVFQSTEGADRILVVDSGNTIAELDWQGNVVAKHPVPVESPDRIDFLRTATEGDRRYFVAWGMGGQQVFVLDESFQTVLRYPEKVSSPHDGTADVVPVDLDGDGKLELAVGYLGIVGVHVIDLQGKREWANRTASVAYRLVALPPDDQGKRNLLVTNTTANGMVVFDAEGRRVSEVLVPGHRVGWIAGTDLDGDGEFEFCGLDPVPFERMIAFGFDLQGRSTWELPLIEARSLPIEQICWGPFFAADTRCWVLTLADGTIRFVDRQGKLLDEFAVGGQVAGIAVSKQQGKPVLLVSIRQATSSGMTGRVVAWAFSRAGDN
ncbi:hypothetical protein JCM19992_26480 [Thermostilla marina]